MAKEATGKRPRTFITPGLPAYHDAYKKEFRTLALSKDRACSTHHDERRPQQ
jgi:hypothetical protein